MASRDGHSDRVLVLEEVEIRVGSWPGEASRAQEERAWDEAIGVQGG